MRKLMAISATAVLAMAVSPALAADAPAVDWSKVPTVTVPLFYPGQSSYEWLRSPEHKKAQKETTEGQACIACHKGEEKTLGAKLVKENALEPTPVKDKVGNIELGVQVAYDAKNAYFRFQWNTQNPVPGNEHQYLRFDGKSWKLYGHPKLDQAVQDGKEPGIYENRLAFMVDDGKVPMFAQQGCWLTCHTGERDMQDAATKEEATANPLMARIKATEVRKYLPATRTDPADWTTGKSAEEIAKLKADGQFLDLIQWRAHRSGLVGLADDGYVLDWRHSDAGKAMFAGNSDSATKLPKFMWDEKKTGYKAITVDQLHKAPHALIKGDNAVAFDPNAGWKEGDMVPDRVLSSAEASGSAIDSTATSEWKDGKWTVVIVRPLGLANADDKVLKDGSVVNVGFAVHDDNITTRGHHVSFPRTVGFGVKADIEAVKLP